MSNQPKPASHRSSAARARLWLALEAGPRWVRRTGLPVSELQGAEASQELEYGGTSPTASLSTAQTNQRKEATDALPACRVGSDVCDGIGPLKAPWMWIVEREEPTGGQPFDPFAGVSGKLLDNLLFALGLSRDDDVYVASVPNGAVAADAAVSCCRASLMRAINRVQPRLVLALGNAAATALDQSALPRGTVQALDIAGRAVAVMVTHGIDGLRTDARVKAETWADLCQARKLLLPA